MPPPRRAIPASTSLSPNDASTGDQPFPRSTSPSGSFTQFLTRPAKWFSRSASAPRVPQKTAEPRSSVSTIGSRKPKISRPTDPRPILEKSPYSLGASKSVADLSIRPPNSLDIPAFPSPGTPTSDLGDLRSISRRGWSRSADDLSKMSPTHIPAINTNFHNKVNEYRGRSDSNASGVVPSTPSSPVSARLQPFPSSVNNSPLSASPPRTALGSGVTISVSAPNVDAESSSASSSNHVHSRSHSFTPKLPSKLSTPRFTPPFPVVVPRRKGSATSEYEGGSDLEPIASGSLGRSIPPLPSSAGKKASPINQNYQPPTLLAPPAVIKTNEERRASQIIYQSGFINRQSDAVTMHLDLTLSKGWKPYKLELKGSKLYFYKPPGDRSTGIKDLFPTGLVPPTPEEETPDREKEDPFATDFEKGGRIAYSRDEPPPTPSRRKRAYWGRQRHPDLVLDSNGHIEKGTFEALVHEMAFGTSFDLTTDVEPWRHFASSVLLTLPHLVGTTRFDLEFLRCTEYLITGAEEEDKPRLRERAGWLASEYHGFGGNFIRTSIWEDWKQHTGADILPIPSSGPPTSTSMHGLYTPSPNPDNNAPPPSDTNVASPHINTFSPRPADQPSTMTSFMDAFTSQTVVIPPFSVTTTKNESSLEHDDFDINSIPPQVWQALKEEGLTRDVLLTFNPRLLADSLTTFHLRRLEQAPTNLTAVDILGSAKEGSGDELKFFFGSHNNPNWLTKALLLNILGGDGLGHGKPHRPDDSGGPVQTSRTHTRSELISAWVQVGEVCRLRGDECTWRSISAALCSRPVARLDKAWKRVDPITYHVVESWANGADIAADASRVTPWGGDLKVKIQEQLSGAKEEAPTEDLWKVHSLTGVWEAFNTFRTAYSLCPKKPLVEENGERRVVLDRLIEFWDEKAREGGGSGSVAAKFIHVDQFMSLSMAAEPQRKGRFEPYFWNKPPTTSLHPNTSPLLPLLFIDPLPSAAFVDRNSLLRGRSDNDGAEGHVVSNNNQPLFVHDRQQMNYHREISESRRSLLGDMSSFSGGTIIPVYNGELLLVVQTGDASSRPSSRPSSRAPSRPPSLVMENPNGEKPPARAPSIRVKPGLLKGLDRKSSMARRSSLPLMSHRNNHVVSEASSGPPIRVQVQAGTLNTLVKILVFGLQNTSVSVADDNGEMSLEGQTRDLSLDRAEYGQLWWHVFRSFITPLVFFELLKKLYITCNIDGSSAPPMDVHSAANIRCQVLDAMKSWFSVGGGSQDMLDEPQLYSAVLNFINNDADQAAARANEVTETPPGDLEMLKSSLQSFVSTFNSQTMRPTLRSPPINKPSDGINHGRMRSMSTRDAPDIDRIDVEEFVDNLDGMVCAAFSNITQEDLYMTSDLLEVQMADRTGWFPPKDFTAPEDFVEVQTMYSQILEVPPSPLISDHNQETFYRLLPPGIRSSIRAYSIIRKWLISRLVAPGIGLRMRQARMEFLLKAVEVVRLRCSGSSVPSQPCIRSGVEAAIVSAILSVESRIHQRAWQNIALNRGVICDTLWGYLSKPSTSSVKSHDQLVVDLGWVIERLLELISAPDVVDSGEEGQSLVSLDKRRHICHFISNTLTTFTSLQSHHHDQVIRMGFERLTNLEREVSHLRFDLRSIKDEASREAMGASALGSSSVKKIGRPFQRLLASQMEKNRRDKILRTRLMKEKSVEQSRIERREEVVNKAMRPRKPNYVPRQHRNKKSMSAFLHFMRPISTAFGADVPSPVRRTAAELDFAPSGKPALVLSLAQARVAQFINYDRSYTFLLDTEDGGHYLLQALNRQEMKRWMENISQVSTLASQRRLTYLGTPQPQVSDHLINQTSEGAHGPLAVFGVDLETLVRREAGGSEVAPGTIPRVIEICLSAIEERGLNEVGIYRIAGASSEISALKDGFNRGECPITSDTDIHAVCDLVKTWFRVLPESVFPPSSYNEVIEAMKIESFDARLAQIRNVVQNLPQLNYDLLKRICEHLEKVSDYEEQNNMTADALAIVFSPNLLRAPRNDFQMILANMGYTHKLVKALITQFNVVFDEGDADPELDAEDDELDSPIAEEDEEEDILP